MNGDEFFSYGYNGWGVKRFSNPHLGLGGHTGDPRWHELHASKLKKPDDMIAIGDSFSDGIWDTWLTPQSIYSTSWPSKRHFVPGAASARRPCARPNQAARRGRSACGCRDWGSA